MGAWTIFVLSRLGYKADNWDRRCPDDRIMRPRYIHLNFQKLPKSALSAFLLPQNFSAEFIPKIYSTPTLKKTISVLNSFWEEFENFFHCWIHCNKRQTIYSTLPPPRVKPPKNSGGDDSMDTRPYGTQT